MKEQLISFETAKLAKEKGLISGLSCNHVYCIGYNDIKESKELIEESSFRNSVSGQFHLALAPTQSLLQKWLRDKYNIHVNCMYSTIREIMEDFGKGMYFWGVVAFPELDEKVECFDTYEEALEEGLKQTLKYIK